MPNNKPERFKLGDTIDFDCDFTNKHVWFEVLQVFAVDVQNDYTRLSLKGHVLKTTSID